MIDTRASQKFTIVYDNIISSSSSNADDGPKILLRTSIPKSGITTESSSSCLSGNNI